MRIDLHARDAIAAECSEAQACLEALGAQHELTEAFELHASYATVLLARLEEQVDNLDRSVPTPPNSVPRVMFGPVDETLCHPPKERIAVGQVLSAKGGVQHVPGPPAPPLLRPCTAHSGRPILLSP